MATTCRALLITNSEFPSDESSKLTELKGPKLDGEKLKIALTDKSFGLFDENHVSICAEKSVPDIKRNIETFIKDAHPDDTLVLYYSGHGMRSGGKLFICGHDTNGKYLMSSGLEAGFIRGCITLQNRAGRVIVVLDCCYAAGFSDKGVAAEQIPTELFGEGQYTLYSSGAFETSKDAEKPGQASPFTEALAQELVNPSLPGLTQGYVSIQQVYDSLFERYTNGQLKVRPEKDDHGAGALIIAQRAGAGQPWPAFDLAARPVAFNPVRLEVKELEARSTRAETIEVLLDLIDALSQRAGLDVSEDELVRRAWQELGSSLHGCLREPHALHDLLATQLDSNTALKLQMSFDPPRLATWPWELMYVDPGPGSEFVGLLDSCQPSRVVAGTSADVPETESGALTVLFASSYDDVQDVPQGERDLVGDVERNLRTLKEIKADRPLNVVSLRGKCSWTQFSTAVSGTVQVVYLFVPVRRDNNKLQAGFTKDGKRDWVDASSLVREFARGHRGFECLVLETIASVRGGSAVRASWELAHLLAETGRGPVVAVCHCPQYAAMRTEDQRADLTFGGRFVAALMRKYEVDQALYEARTKLVQPLHSGQSIFFGVPLLFEQIRTVPRSVARQGGRAEPGPVAPQGSPSPRTRKAS